MSTHYQLNLGKILSRHAKYRANHVAVVFEDKRVTYAEFNARVNRTANMLRNAGIEKGDRIALVLPNCLEFLEIYWAAAKIGAVTVPLSPLLNARGIAGLLNHSGAAMVVASGENLRHISAMRQRLDSVRHFLCVTGERVSGFDDYENLVKSASSDEPPDPRIRSVDPVMTIYSSGTTGDPKGIVLSHEVRAHYCTLYALTWRMTPESVSMHAGSLVFNGAYMTLMPSFFLGGTFVLHKDFCPERILVDVIKQGVTHSIMVPSQIIALMNCSSFSAKALGSIQALISIGATLHLKHKQSLNRLMPGRLYELYGLAEGFHTILDRDDFARKIESVGVPPPLFEIRILDEQGDEMPDGEVGEIAGRGPILMSGYYGRPDLTAQAIVQGWLRSGDLGYVDEEGYLYLVDRKKDMIKSGGVGVYPRDIEEILVTHPAVKEAVVFGIADPKWGETPVAALVLREGAAETSAELREWTNRNVSAKFQRVSDVVILESLPKNAAGKVLKREIRANYLGVKGGADS